ncbi:heme peroxidase [Lipomyces japonicus]|uniref:heme peroxidase n=1 Tax=Lipomyces japonicus TaxID=56871 RepID=UPI0034CF0DDA
MAASNDYEPVRAAIKKILKNDKHDDGSIGPVLVRLAWHASGTYDQNTGTGGSNGATMRFQVEAADAANNGLNLARQFLEPIKHEFNWISYADLWTLAGVTAIEAMGGPQIAWQPGRVDDADDRHVPPNGRLPDASQGQDHIRAVFYRMGFDDQEIVALSGAHNLGRCHGYGFEGPWVPNPVRFSNTYFKLLLRQHWKQRTTSAGNVQYNTSDGELMMLPTVPPHVETYAADRDVFFRHFALAFAKLLELGVHRGRDGTARRNDLARARL